MKVEKILISQVPATIQANASANSEGDDFIRPADEQEYRIEAKHAA